MSIARGLTKAAKAAKKQSRGLTGNRNSQGDFMPEDIQTKGVQEAVAPDIQNYIDDVKKQIDEIDVEIDKLNQDPNYYMPDDIPEGQGGSSSFGPELEKQMEALEAQKEDLLVDLMDKLTSEGVEVPPGLQEMLMGSLTRGERRAFDVAEDDTAKKLSTGEYEIDPMPKFL
jgi:paraquat-inducible protein B